MIIRRAYNILLIVSAILLSGNPAQALNQDEIVVGGLVSLTGPGSVIGVAFSAGTKMAVDEINADGGILGSKLRLVMADTQTNPSAAVSEVMRLMHREKIDVLIGPASSQETGAVVPLATRSKLLQVSSAGSLELTPKVGPYHFSIIANAEGQGAAMVDGAIEYFQAKRPAILGDNGGQARTAVGAMNKRLADHGVESVATQEYQFNTDDLTPQLLALRRENPDVILYFVGSTGDLRNFLESLNSIGWDVPVIGSLALSVYAEAVSQDVPEHYLDNVYGVVFPNMSYCPGDALGESLYAQFYERYKARGIDPDKAPVGTTSYYYSSVYLLKEAIESTASLDTEVLAKWIEEESADLPNLYGPFGASSENHFMFDSNSMILGANLHKPREDKLILRYLCN